jgi:hypothetical protein
MVDAVGYELILLVKRFMFFVPGQNRTRSSLDMQSTAQYEGAGYDLK